MPKLVVFRVDTEGRAPLPLNQLLMGCIIRLANNYILLEMIYQREQYILPWK